MMNSPAAFAEMMIGQPIQQWQKEMLKLLRDPNAKISVYPLRRRYYRMENPATAQINGHCATAVIMDDVQ